MTTERTQHARGILDTSAVIALSQLRSPDDFAGIDGLEVLPVEVHV